ncbi:MAG: secretin N-terminal domain-containing protein [Nitrospirota bacterium]
MKFVRLCLALLLLSGGAAGRTASAAMPEGITPGAQWVTIDFVNVELPIVVKFISELIGKNFVIDEKVKGKVTIYSPAKISVEKAYQVFEAVLELKGFRAIPSGEIIQIVPVTEALAERNLYVYSLANANAEEVAKVLGALQAARPAAAGVTQRGVSTGNRFDGPVQVLPDKPTNSLIITASQTDYETLVKIIQQLDEKRRQVYVEAVIMEVGLDRLKELGTDVSALIGYTSSRNDLTVIGGANQPPEDLFGLVNLPSGVTLQSINIRTALRVLQSYADVNILSTPQLLASDNTEAEIIVGEERPFPTGQSETTGGTVLTRIERKDVGITLKMTPQILEDDVVRLDLFQEISTVSESVSQEVGNVAVGPTTNKRSADTSIIVNNRQTVVIGGLIRDNQSIAQRKIPLLGDIPILGWLFKFKTVRNEKTNLLIFLTPYIISNQTELASLKARKQREVGDFLERERMINRDRFAPYLSPEEGGTVLQ